MSARTPSMTLTTIPTTRPSSSTRTTSFDLRSARRHRGRWGPLPVWTGRSFPRKAGSLAIETPAAGPVSSVFSRLTNCRPGPQ